jgi:DNA-binding transcriptional MerR regulator
MQGSGELTIDELAADAAVPVRTVRFYIAEGLLPGPSGRGRGASYGEEHRLRLRLIRRLVEQRVPLAEIGDRLAQLSPAELRDLVGEEEQRASTLAEAQRTASPRDYVSALLRQARERRGSGPPAPSSHSARPAMVPRPLAASASPALAEQAQPLGPGDRETPEESPGERWRRLPLGPGLELHVRADVERRYSGLIAALLKLAKRSLAAAGRGEPGEMRNREGNRS